MQNNNTRKLFIIFHVSPLPPFFPPLSLSSSCERIFLLYVYDFELISTLLTPPLLPLLPPPPTRKPIEKEEGIRFFSLESTVSHRVIKQTMSLFVK